VTGAYASDSKADSLESDDDPADFPVDTETEPENVSDNKEYLYIVMELCPSGSLKDWLQRNMRRRRLKRIMKLFCEICSGLAYIHGKGIFHRDLKPANIFLTKEGCIKIGDFGFALVEDPTDLPRESVGTEVYMAPEQYNEEYYDHKVDIFSLGLIFLELLIPCNTFTERQAILKRILYRNSHEGLKEKHLLLLRKMLDTNPVERPEAIQVLQYLKEKKAS
jgi:serine/threonine protein kinase